MVADRARLLELIRGYRISQAIYVATKLGIPELLADGPRDIDDLARATGAHPLSLRRLLSFLVGIGVFDQVTSGRMALTPMASTLRAGGARIAATGGPLL